MDKPPIRIEYKYTISDAKGEYTAHATVKRVGGVLWLTDVWTHADYRGKGYATALMTEALQEWGGETLYLDVEPYTDQPLDAQVLTAWYGRFGFVATEVPGVLRRGGTRNG